MNLVIDMNLSPDWIGFLSRGGHRAVHWSSIGDPRATDRSILEWARKHEHVLITHDLDHGAILAATKAVAPSVLQLRAKDILPDRLGHIVLSALEKHADVLIAGALVTVDPVRSRSHILPLGDG